MGGNNKRHGPQPVEEGEESASGIRINQMQSSTKLRQSANINKEAGQQRKA